MQPPLKTTNDSVWAIPGRRRTGRWASSNSRSTAPRQFWENTLGPLASGEQLLDGRFEIRRLIAYGGMSVVYEAHDEVRQTAVALKFLTPALLQDARAVEQFLQEARISANLNHPSILRIFEVHRHEEIYFLEMELLEGQTLRQTLIERKTQREPLDFEFVGRVARSVCDALIHAHQSTVHRDIKPENVGLTKAGEIKLMDFGLARLLEQPDNPQFRQTLTQLHVGTPYYMAPEQLGGGRAVDQRADQFSLAVVIYELLTGELPLGIARPVEERRPDLPERFCRAVDRALSNEPKNRFENIAVFSRELAAGMNERNTLRTWMRRHPRWLRAARAALLLVLAAGVVFAGGRRWRDHLRLKEEELQQAWTRLSAAEGRVAVLGQWIKERESTAQVLERRLAVENRLWEGGIRTPEHFETLLTLSNEIASVRSIWKWLDARVTPQRSLPVLDEWLSLGRSALQDREIAVFERHWRRLLAEVEAAEADLPVMEQLFAQKNLAETRWRSLLELTSHRHLTAADPVSQRAGPLTRPADPLSPSEGERGPFRGSKRESFGEFSPTNNPTIHQSNHPFSSLDWLRQQALESFQGNDADQALVRFREFNARASAILEESFQAALAEFQQAKNSWGEFFPDLGPPGLSFLADPEGLHDRAVRAQKAQQHGLAIGSLVEAASIYRSWTSDLKALHRRVDPVWNALAHRKIENDLGMRFVRAAGVYWSIWETRVMDFARFVQEEGRGYRGAGEFWKNPGYAQSPVDPVVGIDRATAEHFAIWLNSRWKKFRRPETQLPKLGHWKAAIETAGKNQSLSIGIFPQPEEWHSDHYRDKYREARFDARRFVKPVAMEEANAFGLYDMDGNVWEWSQDFYDHPNTPGPTPTTWMLHGGGRFGEVSYHAFELPEPNMRFIGQKEAIGFRVVVHSEE